MRRKEGRKEGRKQTIKTCDSNASVGIHNLGGIRLHNRCVDGGEGPLVQQDFESQYLEQLTLIEWVEDCT